MTTAKPAWATEYPTYEQLVESWGHTVISFDTTGHYQGDHEVLLRDAAGRWGITVIGYGSCSGCDALESVTPWGSDGDWSLVVTLAESLAADVTWFDSTDAALAWIDAKLARDPNKWWAFDDEVRDVLTKYRKFVTEDGAGR